MKPNRLLGIALISCIISSALADTYQLPAPDMSAYMAYPTPKPPLSQRARNAFSFFQGWYISGGATYAGLSLNSISNSGPATAGITLPTVFKTSVSESKFVPNIALGYQIRQSGIFSRAEISYTPFTSIPYDSSPFINLTATPNSINSSVSSNLILFKVYDDFNLDMPIMPYIQLGIGAAINKVSGNSSIIIDPTFTIPPFTSTFSSTKTNVAGDAGLGVRWLISDNFALGLGYEFDYLGNDVTWNMNFTNPILPSTNVTLKSGIFFANTVTASLTWQPLAKYSSDNTNSQMS